MGFRPSAHFLLASAVCIAVVCSASPAGAGWKTALVQAFLRHWKSVGADLGKGAVGAAGTAAIGSSVEAYQSFQGDKRITVETGLMSIDGERWRRATTAQFCVVPKIAGRLSCKPCDMDAKGHCNYRVDKMVAVECSAPLVCLPFG